MSVAVCKTNTGLLQGQPEDGGTIHLHTHTHWAEAQWFTVLGEKLSPGFTKEKKLVNILFGMSHK